MDEIDNTIKIEEIERCNYETESNVRRLINFCSDQDAEVRYRALESLRDIINPEVQDCVYAALSDPDELVAVTSLEILGDWRDPSRQNTILNLLSDERDLVRSAAAISIGMIGIKSARDKLIEKLDSCDDEEEKVGLIFALCKLGKDQYFYSFLNGVFHLFYRIRCATANLVTNLITESNQEFIINLLSEVLRNEETAAAKSSLTNAINSIKNAK